MPVHPVRRKGRDGTLRLIGYQWGSHGKIYLIRSFGKRKAFELARLQGVAVKISQSMRA